MGDMGDTFRDLTEHKKRLRAKYGVPCPECQSLLPKAQPKILLPAQRCSMHNYRDPRPELTDEQWSQA